MTALVRVLVVTALPVLSGPSQQKVRVGFYQGIRDCKTTLCISTYGEAVIYEGSLDKLRPLTGGDDFALCLETQKTPAELAKAMDYAGALHRFGALAR